MVFPSTKWGEQVQRRGRFKKASNTNYCLDFSLRVEDEILRLISEQEKREQSNPFTTPQESNQENPFEVDDDFYDQVLHTILQKYQGRTWASGNTRLGDIILIVDSDTRVVSILILSRTQEANDRSLKHACIWQLWRCWNAQILLLFSTQAVF